MLRSKQASNPSDELLVTRVECTGVQRTATSLRVRPGLALAPALKFNQGRSTSASNLLWLLLALLALHRASGAFCWLPAHQSRINPQLYCRTTSTTSATFAVLSELVFSFGLQLPNVRRTLIRQASCVHELLLSSVVPGQNLSNRAPTALCEE